MGNQIADSLKFCPAAVSDLPEIHPSDCLAARLLIVQPVAQSEQPPKLGGG